MSSNGLILLINHLSSATREKTIHLLVLRLVQGIGEDASQLGAYHAFQACSEYYEFVLEGKNRISQLANTTRQG